MPAKQTRLNANARRAVRGVLAKRFDVSVTGQQNIPETGGCIIAPNHVDLNDPYILLGWITARDIGFLNRYDRKDTFKLEVLEHRRRLGNHLIGGTTVDRTTEPGRIGYSRLFPRVDNGSQALAATKRQLQADRAICIFSEGNRSPEGRLQRLKQGIAYLALDSALQPLPVVPVGISYGQEGSSQIPVIINIGEPLMPRGSKQSSADRHEFLGELSVAIQSLTN